MKRILLKLVVAIVSICSNTHGEEWASFSPPGDSWPRFLVPKSFELHPDSYIGEDMKWTAKFAVKNSSAALSVSPFGFVSERFRDAEGFETPRDVVLIYELSSARRIEKDEYEIFIETKSLKTRLLFVSREPNWGRCFNWATFEHGDWAEEQISDFLELFIENYVPAFTD